MFETDNCINLKEYGAKGDGVSDDSEALQNAVNSLAGSGTKGIIYVPAGRYVLKTAISLGQNITISGSGASSEFLIQGAAGTSVFTGTDADNITLENFKMTLDMSANKLLCAELTGCSGITLRKLDVNGMLLANIGGSKLSDGSYRIVKDIYIQDNRVCGSGGEAGNYYAASTAVNVRFVDNAVITGNRIESCGHGIEWWGGDSNHTRDGQPENPRLAKNIVISNNIVTNVTGGGIWGSMGENLTITHNVVTHAHDVGIDLEGCYYSTVSDNVVYDCTNGGIVTFFFCRGTVISGNTVYSDTPNQYAFKIYNAAQTVQNEDILVTGNTFVNTSAEGGLAGGDNCEKIVYSNNNFVNVFIRQQMNNSRYTKINANHFIIDKQMQSAVFPISAGTTHKNGELIIQDNIIESYEKQPEGSAAISAVQSDNSSSSTNLISGNIIRGFDTDIITNNNSIRVRHMFYISDNVTESGAFRNNGDGNVRYGGNYSASGKYTIGEVPTSGYWQKGQIIYFNSPDMEGYAGAVCVQEGEPGVWKYFGKY